MAMDMRKIKKLIELIQETGIAEIEIREGEESVRISRESNRMVPMMNMPANLLGCCRPEAAPVRSAAPVEPQPAAVSALANKHTRESAYGWYGLSFPLPGRQSLY